MPWIDMARVAIAPTLDDETLRSRGLMKIDADAAEGPTPKRQRARPHLGEQVCSATMYGRRYRARLKAARTSGSV
jgi:hypothetical protein